MNCYSIKKLLNNKRLEVLSPDEMINIESHIKNCDSCSRSFAESIKYERMLSLLQKSEPILKNPEVLTNTIIDSTLDLNFQRNSSSLMDNFFDFIEFPKLQFALKTILALIICFYLLEEYSLTNEISELENRLYSQSVSEAGLHSIIEKEISFINKLEGVYNLFTSEKDYLQLNGEWVIMRSSEQKKILSYYISYVLKDRYDREELNEIINRLDKINFLDGLNADETKELDKHKELIESEIKQIKGG